MWIFGVIISYCILYLVVKAATKKAIIESMEEFRGVMNKAVLNGLGEHEWKKQTNK